jgi:phosphoglycolate phosphatase-like HAD superfamily hydrolase
MQRINIFDFDGTIAESNILKTEAFRYTAVEYGEKISEWFVDYHKANGGVTRQVKIETLCKKIGKAEAYDELLGRYEVYLEKEWLDCPLLPGFREYIATLPGRNVILSGGSKVEIELYLKENNLSQYFIEVYGNPIDKHVNLESINIKYLSAECDVYFYGDSSLDYELSQIIDSKFIFVSPVSEWSSWIEEKDGFYEVLNSYSASKYV